VDPNLKSLRLFYKVNGSFSNDQVLATVPMMVQSGKTYHAKIVANGANIKVYFDGSLIPVIDINDTRFSNGYLGVNVFGGRAYYQNVYCYLYLSTENSAIRSFNFPPPMKNGTFSGGNRP
jgi:levanbiose-producing levanase